MRNYRIRQQTAFCSILVGSIFFLAFEPLYFGEVPFISKYDAIERLFVVVGTALFYYVHKKKIINIMFPIAIFAILQIIVTIFNQSDIVAALWGNGVLLLSMCGCTQWGYEYNEKVFIKTLYFLFYFLLVVNFVTLLIFPNGMYVDSRGIRESNYFLGNYNNFSIYMLLAIALGYLRHEGNLKRKIDYILLWILCFATLLIKKSATSFVVLLVLGVYVLFLNRKWTRWLFNIKTYILINIVIFFSVVWNANAGVLLGKAVSLLKKDITFTGRTFIWSTAIQYIKRKWILGYGYKNGDSIRIAFNNIQAVHCHNLYLNILYKNGIVGLIIIAFILMIVLYKLKYLNNDKTRYFLEAYIGVFMLRYQFEADFFEVVFFMFVFLYLYCCNHGRNQKKEVKQK